MSKIAMKFGGTSMGSIESIKQVAQIICQCADEGNQVVAVVSAMSGVTDSLIKAARTAETGDVRSYRQLSHEMQQRHIQAAQALVTVSNRLERLTDEIRNMLEDFEQLCYSISIMREVTSRGMDVVTSLGERMSARLLAAHLEDIGRESRAIDSSQLIITNDNFQNAAPDMEVTGERIQARLLPMLERGVLPVVTGFIGATPNGTITTLGRGGSDYSGGIVAACLPADELWIWTDVDGVLTADPRIAPEARTLKVLGYDEVAELAYFGAKVLHPRTILPLRELKIPIRVRNTFNPAHEGTWLRPEPEIVSGVIKSVATVQNVHLMTVYGRGMVGVPGIAGRTFMAVARAGASMLMFAQSSSEQSFCFIVPGSTSPAAKKSIEQELELEIARRDVEGVAIAEEVVILTVVGAGMAGTPGVAARVFGALGTAKINVQVIAQGASEYSLSMVVDSKEAAQAVKALHELVANGGD